MDLQQLRDLLLIRIRKVNLWGADEIIDDIVSSLPYAEIVKYTIGSDKQLCSLIAETKKRMNSEAHSPGREFPTLSLSSQSKGFSKRKPRSHFQNVNQRNSYEEQVLKNGSDPGIDTEKSSVTITANMVRRVTHSPPSHSRRALDGEDLTGSTCVSDGPLWPSTDKKLQSSSIPDDNVPVRVDAIPCPPSSSPLTTVPCHSYITLGVCHKVCPFSHGFKPLGRLEMDIRQFLRDKPSGIMVANLPPEYFQRYRTSVLVLDKEWDWSSLLSFLNRLHTTKVLHQREGPRIILLEYAPVPRARGSGSNKIYITSSNADSSLTEKHVCDYFSQYGPVTSSTIHNRDTRMVGFVEFENPGSVSLLLLEWHCQIPHSIFSGSPFNCYQARVFVKSYKQKVKLRYSNFAEEPVLTNECAPGTVTEKRSVTITQDMASPVTHGRPSQRGLEGEVVTGSPSVLDGPSANEHTQDITALLPDDEECFYNPT